LDVFRDSDKISVYNRKIKEFAVGDRIVFLKNDKNLNIQNGQLGVIQNIQNGVITSYIEGDKEGYLKFNICNKGANAYNYIDHAYALSLYKLQGSTSDYVILNFDSSKDVLSYNSSYVALTRCKISESIYTDNFDVIRFKSRHEQEKESTISSKYSIEDKSLLAQEI
jgi:ATP-dependent exoDNAse (exonuclease V) alpha subunit